MTKKLVPVLILAVCAACSSSGVAPEDQLTQESRTLVRYQGPELQALVSYRWADAHLGDEWLVLVAWIAGGHAATTRIEREAIRVRGPDGTRYPLPSQQAFREAYPEILSSLRSVDLSYPPGRGFGSAQEPCGRWFLAAPFEGFAYDTVDVTPFRFCSGLLVFLVPGGVQPGPWTLEIDLPESKVRVPFVLGEGDT
jgi:hypothetical protein